jgi:hypothetical protein
MIDNKEPTSLSNDGNISGQAVKARNTKGVSQTSGINACEHIATSQIAKSRKNADISSGYKAPYIS